ncbi:MAG: P-loop NTPase [Nitrososphaeria archaeon]|nr:P-loop NTPase [Nitrososphaeria archaeon]MDW8022108.1 P-loop NTPase [Nitrososphaerota archaeon]
MSDELVDPRLSLINERLKEIDRIIAVASGKGGVGKSLISSALALLLSRRRKETGLLDLDFTNPSTHVILAAESNYPLEDKGIVPPKISGVKYFSIVFFTGDRPSPLRGHDITNAFIEILALTRWGKLDYLVIDTPPGLGDVLLDLLKLIEKISFIIVSTPSTLSLGTVKKLVSLLKEVNAPIIGVIENMKRESSPSIRGEVEAMGVRYLGSIPFDHSVEDALGKPDALLETPLGKCLNSIADII